MVLMPDHNGNTIGIPTNQQQNSNTPTVNDDPTVVPTIIVPGEPVDKWQNIKEHAKNAVSEYLNAAKAMRLPVPEFKPKPESPPAISQPFQKYGFPAPPPTIKVVPRANTAENFSSGTQTPVFRHEVPPPVVTMPLQKPAVHAVSPAQNLIRPENARESLSTANEAALNFMRKNTPQAVTAPGPATGTGQQPGTVRNYKSEKARIIAEYIETENLASEYGRILSSKIDLYVKPAARFVSSFFYTITFVYITLTLLLFGIIIALAITLTNSGAPGFIYLKYYPKTGLLPILTCLMTIMFLYIGHKIRDSSRLSWFLGVISLLVLPVYSSLVMPVMAYPLIKMVSVFAGTPEKPIISPSLSVTTLAHYFSVFMIFELCLIVLLAYIKSFSEKSRPVGENAKTSIIVIFVLIFIPVTSVVGYGYWRANDTDFGLGSAESSVSYRIYYAPKPPGNRTNATNFIANEELAGRYDAVKVVYDIPLPSLIQTGIKSPITVKQVKVIPDFNLEKFALRQERDSGTTADAVTVTNAVNRTGFITRRNPYTYLWTLMPEDILIGISSETADDTELIATAEALR
jgi:hypothetical protein